VIQIRLELSPILEKSFLAAFFIVLLFIGPGNAFDHRIKHEFPYGYLSSDSFQHQVRAEAIKEIGNFRYEANYIAKGLEKVTGNYPPWIYHPAVILSYLSGLEAYDTIYLMTFLLVIAAVFVMYILIKNFNRNVALLALPLALIVISPPLYINQDGSLARVSLGINTGFAYGHWPSMLAQFFIIAFAWSLMSIKLEKSYFLIGIFGSAIVLAHTSEAVFAAIFAVLFIIVSFISKSLAKDELKALVFAGIITFVLSFYYIIIFLNTWAPGEAYHFNVMPAWQDNPGIYIQGFGILLLLIAAGIVFSFFKAKDMHASFVLGFAMLLAGFMNYIGFETRAFQMRFFWPLYLAVFFGFGSYMLVRLIVKNINIVYSIAISIAFVILLLGAIRIPFLPYYEKQASQGLMDPYHWAAFGWLSKNTEKDAKLYFLYGDIYTQDAVLRSSKRVHFLVDPEDFATALNERKIKKTFITELPGDSGGGLIEWTGLFDFRNIGAENPPEYYFGPRNICSFDYIIIDKASRTQSLAQYNLLIGSELLKKGADRAYENEVVAILKNNNVGADCIEERNF